MELVLGAVFSLVFVGFFAGVEIAFISLNQIALEVKRIQGSRGAKLLSAYLRKPESFLTSHLVLFNAFVALFSHLVERICALLYPVHHGAHAPTSLLYIFIETLVATAFVFFTGEVIPKILFRKYNLSLLLFLSPLLCAINWVFSPVSRVVLYTTELILRYVFRVKSSRIKDREFTYVDLEEYVQLITPEQTEDNLINKNFLENVRDFSHLQVRSCCIHKHHIKAVSVTDSFTTIKKKFIETKVSRLVVYRGDLDNIVGYIHILDIVRGRRKIEDMLIPMPIISESMSARNLLEVFFAQKKNLAWVVDEYGLTTGIVTVETLLEEIFGEDIHKDSQDDGQEFVAKQLSEREFLFSGTIPLEQLREKYNIQLDSEDVISLCGLLIKTNRVLPHKNQVIKIGKYLFTVDSLRDNTVDLVRVYLLE